MVEELAAVVERADLVPLFATGPGTAALEGFGTAFSLGQQLAAWLAE